MFAATATRTSTTPTSDGGTPPFVGALDPLMAKQMAAMSSYNTTRVTQIQGAGRPAPATELPAGGATSVVGLGALSHLPPSPAISHGSASTGPGEQHRRL